MSDKRLGGTNTRLVDAVRRIKIANAERGDVVVDIREADRARLELLAQHMQPVFDDVPLDDERFDFALSSGLQPRLWIDATAHVMMGRDRRTYLFVRDTRLGRIVLAETASVEPVAEKVTDYIAERLHERELAFAGDEMTVYRQGVSQRPPAGERSGDGNFAETVPADAGSAIEAKVGAELSDSKRQARAVPGPADRRDRRGATAMSLTGWLLIAVMMAAAAAALIFRDTLAGF